MNNKLLKIDLTPYLIALILSTLFLGYAPSSIALGLFVAYVFIRAFLTKTIPSTNIAMLIPIVLYLYFATTYFWSIDKGLTIKGIGRMISLAIIPIAFFMIPKFTRKAFDLVLTIFTSANVLFGVIFLITSFIRYLDSHELNEFSYHSLVSFLDLNAVYVSVYFLISFFYLLSKKDKSHKNILSITFLFVLLLLLASKITLVILIAGILGWFLINRQFFLKSKKKVIAIIFIVLISGIFASKRIVQRVIDENKTRIEQVIESKRFSIVYNWTGTSIRLLQLKLLKEQLNEDNIFWTGYGLFASRVSLAKKHQKLNTFEAFHSYNYHNTYAQTLSETGIFGLVLLFIMLIYNFIRAIKSNSFLFVVFSSTILIWFFTESTLWVQRGLFFFIIFYCLFNYTKFSPEEKPE